MYRKVLFILLALSASVGSFSQKFNSNGEKMVSRLEIYNYNVLGDVFEKTVIRYSYDRLSMKSISKETTTSDGGDIGKNPCAKTYRSSISINDKCYTMNGNRLITEIKDRFTVGAIESYVKYDFSYGAYNKPSQMHYRWYNKRGNVYVPHVDDYLIRFTWNDENMYVDDYKMSYSSYSNDTNINPNVFLFVGDNRSLFDDDGYQYSSEWFNMKSKNLLEDIVITGGITYLFHIENIFDENANLTEIVMHRDRSGKKTVRKVIKVVYER